jgi:hypothetical protein
MAFARRFLLGWIALAWLPGEGMALERASRAMPDDRDAWTRASTVALRYYNICTGWAWSWSDFAPNERVGVSFVAPLNVSGNLVATSLFAFSGAPSGYGYTGTVDVHLADTQGCPTTLLQSQPYLPTSTWSTHLWNVSIPQRFVVSITLPGTPEAASLYNFTSDRPAAGPTGPIACGSCYPTTRATRSFLYGPASIPDCPGTPFFDGFCNAELFLEAYVKYFVPIQPLSWGGIKALYR